MIDIYAKGLVTISVCAPADMAHEEIERLANLEYPTGIESRWTISDEATFADGSPHPGICEGNENSRHYLLHC